MLPTIYKLSPPAAAHESHNVQFANENRHFSFPVREHCAQ